MSSLPSIYNISAPLTNPDLRDDATCLTAAREDLAHARCLDTYRPSTWKRLNQTLTLRRKQSPSFSYAKVAQQTKCQQQDLPTGPLHKFARACDRLFGRLP